MKYNLETEEFIQFVLSDDILSVASALTDEEKLLFDIWFMQQLIKCYTGEEIMNIKIKPNSIEIPKTYEFVLNDLDISNIRVNKSKHKDYISLNGTRQSLYKLLFELSTLACVILE